MPEQLTVTEAVRRLNDVAQAALEELLDHLAQGNEGRAEVDQFEVIDTTLKFHAVIHHKHVTKIIGQKITVYAVDTPVEGECDLLNPSDSDLEICVDSPIGRYCVNLRDIISIIAGFLF